MASSDGLQYRALYEYRKDREEDLALCPGDLLTVSKAGVLGLADYKEGAERSPQGWLNGFNERTKEWGDFPGTYVEYLGPVRLVAAALKARPRPVPPTPTGTPTSQLWGPAGQAEFAELRLPEQAPLIVMRLIEALEKQGINNECLYRAPPGSFSNPELKQALLTDASALDLDPFDGQTLAQALKWYLQELPCPVIYPEIYSELLYTAQDIRDREDPRDATCFNRGDQARLIPEGCPPEFCLVQFTVSQETNLPLLCRRVGCCYTGGRSAKQEANA
ncbi:phosphatidylinositol 3-kinase regulatory subunit alpha-like [Emydura macquarii macquarii]|uniref:phosphatidylinositol 3-kinase regulatory subunit alpha-like n=1 Tax=Emydura macquarii macquarii TaxID=1129001 RepID=UPI00352A31BF